MLHEEDEMYEQVYPDPDLRDNYACINTCYNDKNQAKCLKCKSPPSLLAEVMTYPGRECRAVKLKEDLRSLIGGLENCTTTTTGVF